MDDLGLKRGTVQLREHNAKWKSLFEEEKKRLLKDFPESLLEVSHGGSTAIPDIPAKPIIDMFAVVPSLDTASDMRAKLEKLGYHHRGADGVPERILFVKGDEENRTHHLQLVEHQSSEWKNHLLIKRYYLRHPEVAQQYAELKRALAAKYPNDRAAYGKGKDAFIKNVIKNAEIEASRDQSSLGLLSTTLI